MRFVLLALLAFLPFARLIPAQTNPAPLSVKEKFELHAWRVVRPVPVIGALAGGGNRTVAGRTARMGWRDGRSSLGLALGTLSNVAQELWPDARKKLFHR